MPIDTAQQTEDEFRAALAGEDELGVVLRAHIFIEASLNELIDNLVPRPKLLAKIGLDYSQKVTLACAIGLEPRYESPLLALGTLRNAFAHRPGTRLSKDRVNSLYASFSGQDKTLIQSVHQRTRKQAPDSKVPAFSRLDPKSQFILIAVAFRALLYVALKQCKSGA